MLTVCSTSQVAYCGVSSDGALSVASKIQLPTSPLCNALAWDSTTNNLLLPTRSALLSLDPAGKKLPNTLKTWKSAPIQTLVFTGPKNTLCYCQNNKLIVVEPRGQPRALIQGDFCNNVTAIQTSKDLTYIACYSSDFWAFDTVKKSRITLEGIHNEEISSFCFSTHQTDRLYASDRGDILLYNLLTSPFPSKRVAIGDSKIISMAASPVHHGRLALVDCKGRIYIYDTNAESLLLKRYTESLTITCLSWSENGVMLYAGSTRGKLISFNTTDISQEPEVLAVGDESQSIYCAQSMPIKLKSSTSKVVRVVSSSQQKQTPLTDGTNVIRSVSSPNIRLKPSPNDMATLSSPNTKVPNFKGRNSDIFRRTLKKSPLTSKNQNRIGKLDCLRSSQTSTPTVRRTSRRSVAVRPSSSQPSEATKEPEELPRSDSQHSTTPPSSSPPVLSTGSGRTGIVSPSTSGGTSKTLRIPRDALLVSPSLPAMAFDSAVTAKLAEENLQASPKRPSEKHAEFEQIEKEAAEESGPAVIPRKRVNIDRPSLMDARVPSLQTKLTNNSIPPGLVAINEIKNLIELLREETRDNILNLHLDLLRMNSVLRTQMQVSVQSCLSDWQQLKGENERLRAENAWLRSM